METLMRALGKRRLELATEKHGA